MAQKELVDVEVLASFPIFKDMSRMQLAKIEKIIRLENYSAGQTVWEEGDSGQDFFLLIKGTVDITQKLTLFTSEDEVQSRDKSLISLTSEMKPVIGEIALCANCPRSAAVIADTDVVLAYISPNDLEDIMSSDPSIGFLLFRNISTTLAQRLISANQNVLKLTTAFSLALQRGT
ncbi:MAG: cyclic nucleotide-binding domain-containing protein [Candidatus Electryonea clarkiae]|nr:cyclic nucleotide-binding domain-containing protein [Candidatus Electryonea clarkiae]MDP8286593.1 cyclic nucleotide-binding domain-containing protein [Candidatus Electryonea clarkiae]